MLKKILPLLLLPCLLLTGCWDAIVLDDQVFVVNMGVDVGLDGGVIVTIQLPDLAQDLSNASESTSSDGAQNDMGKFKRGGYLYAQGRGVNLMDAIDSLRASIPRMLDFLQLKQLIFSIEATQQEDFIGMLTYLIQARQVRQAASFIVSLGRAEEIIFAQLPYIGVLTKSEESHITSLNHQSVIPATTFGSFYNDLCSNYESSVAILGNTANTRELDTLVERRPIYDAIAKEYLVGTKNNSGQNLFPGEQLRRNTSEIDFFGSALFSDDCLALILTGYETMLLNMVRNDFVDGLFTSFDSRGNSVYVNLRLRRASTVKVDPDGPTIQIHLYLEGITLTPIWQEDYTVITDHLIKELGEDLDLLLKRCQEEGVDAFRFGARAMRYFPTIQAWEAYDWNARYPGALIETTMEIVLYDDATTLNQQQ